MSEELQQEPVVMFDEDSGNPGNPAQGDAGSADGNGDEQGQPPEQAPTGDQPEEVTFDERQQAKVNELIGHKVARQRQAERERDELRRKLEEIEKSSRPTRPVMPKRPDPLSMTQDEYERAMDAYDNQVKAVVSYDAEQRRQEELARHAQAEAQRKENEALVKQAQIYNERSVRLGVDQSALVAAASVMGEYLDPNNAFHNALVGAILADETGPLITQYLGSNREELETLLSLSPVQAGLQLNAIRSKAAVMKRKVQGAPPPIQKPARGNAAVQDYGVEGAIYE